MLPFRYRKFVSYTVIAKTTFRNTNTHTHTDILQQIMPSLEPCRICSCWWAASAELSRAANDGENFYISGKYSLGLI